MILIFIAIAFGMGFGQAGAALVAQHTGAGNHRLASRSAAQMLLLLCGIATLLAWPLAIFAPLVLSLAQVPESVMPGATSFLRIILVGLPIMAFSIGYGSALRALGNTSIVLLIGVVTNAINLVLDPLLIFGLGPAPELGVRGAAVATVASRLVNALICVHGLRRGWAGLRLHLPDFHPQWALMRKNLSIGMPLAVANSSNALGISVYQVMVNSLGATVMGGVMIGLRVVHFFNVPARAMALATASVVGQALGARKVRLAARAVATSAGMVAAIMLIPLVLLILKGQLVASAFTGNAAVVKEAGIFFQVVPASSYCFGVLMVLLAAFYGSGHTRPAMFVHIIRLWGLRLPMAYVFAFVLGMGSWGIYLGMAGGNVLSAIGAYILFRSGIWKSAVVQTGE